MQASVTPLDLLAAGIPPTLLFDLAIAPDSGRLLREEGGDTEWLPAALRRSA
jgi:hypothetical protein